MSRLGCPVHDPAVPASHFNWLVMAEPLNRAMLLGDEANPGNGELLPSSSPNSWHTRGILVA